MRYFLAVEIDSIDTLLTAKVSQIARVPQHHHLTLQFFGELEEDDLNWIKRKLDSFSFKSFTFQTDMHYSAFANWDNCDTIYVGVENKQLNRLASQLRSLFRERFVGKDFVPHITVGRVKQSGDLVSVQQVKLEPMSVKVTSLSLLASDFTQDGVLYRLVKKVKLS